MCLPAVKSCQPEAASRVGQTSRRLLTPAFSMPSACVLPRRCSSRWPRATEHGPWCSSDGVVGGAGVVTNCLEEAFERLQILERSERSQCSILSILRAREIFLARCVPWASRFSVGAHGLVAGARGALVLVAARAGPRAPGRHPHPPRPDPQAEQALSQPLSPLARIEECVCTLYFLILIVYCDFFFAPRARRTGHAPAPAQQQHRTRIASHLAHVHLYMTHPPSDRHRPTPSPRGLSRCLFNSAFLPP